MGKTSIAKRYCELFEIDSIDLDEYIEEKTGQQISEIMTNSESEFRAIESGCLEEISNNENDCIVAVGAGAVLNSRNIVTMKNKGIVVFLNALEKDLVDRLSADTLKHRPLLEGDLVEKVAQQYKSRSKIYDLASDVTIATTNRSLDQVCEAVNRQVSRLQGNQLQLSNNIIVGKSILENIASYLRSYKNVVLITQENIPEKYWIEIEKSCIEASINIYKIIVESSEQAKSFASYEKVINEMATLKITRNDAVIALGGGVVGDLSGFVAATYYRGIDVIQVPTTLLAQIDSSIGGKCGINLDAGKNLVGAFHQPKTIFADIEAISSLPFEDYKSGLGEVAKYALLGNSQIADLILNHGQEILDRDENALIPLIRSCMNHKVQVVSVDPYERTGTRATLNLGHTLAHALETKSNYDLAHGNAVAIGLRFVSLLSLKLDLISEAQYKEKIDVLDALDLGNLIPGNCKSPSELVDLMYSDKKSVGGLSFVLFDGDKVSLHHDIDRDVVEAALKDFLH
ncbi:MAG: 3-dehydroquinate synthase [Acidimicrobiia bacterium]